MTECLYVPSTEVKMPPIEGLRFYADALRGNWGSIDGRSEKLALNQYIDWAATVDATETTEADVLAKLREYLGVYVIEEFFEPDHHARRGIWYEHVSELVDAEAEATQA